MIHSTNILYGLNAISNIVKKTKQIIDVIYILKKNKKTTNLITHLKKKKVNYIYITKSKITNLIKLKKKYSVICKLKTQINENQFTIQELIKHSKNPLFLLLDRLQDPHNLGACIRTAEAANVTGVIITKTHSANLTPLVNKISCGGLTLMPIIKVSNIIKTIKLLQKYNIFVIGLSSSNTNPLYKNNLTVPIAVILGSETDGIKQLTKKTCDTICNIPMQGKCKSLNVSVATGISLFEIQRQRNFI